MAIVLQEFIFIYICYSYCVNFDLAHYGSAYTNNIHKHFEKNDFSSTQHIL